jgi:hypothetical protein
MNFQLKTLQKTGSILLVIILLFGVAMSNVACGQFSPTQITGTTYTIKGFGQLAATNGTIDRANLHRATVSKTGVYGLSGYFASLTNQNESSVGLGLVSDKLKTLKGRRKIILAMFENGQIKIKARTADYGTMTTLTAITQPIGAWLKCQVTGTEVAFYYSTSTQSATNPSYTLIGSYANILPTWTDIKQTYCVASALNSYQTATVTSVSEYNGTGGGSLAYNLASMAINQMSGNVTRFQITPIEINKPVGDVIYSLVIRDVNTNIVYADNNISTNTAIYPTIDFTPAYSGFTPHVTTAGNYTVTLTANGVSQSQLVTFSNANLGLSTTTTNTAGFLNNSSWTAPTATVAAQIKYIGCEAGTIANNGTRTINLVLSATPDPNQHKITVVRGSNSVGTNINVLLINGILLTGNDFFVKTGDIHQLQWIYSNLNPPIENIWWNEYSNTNTAILTFNVTKN